MGHFRYDSGKMFLPIAPLSSERRCDMALTKEYLETVLTRIRRDPKFARSLYAEAMNALLEGETEEGLSMLRDLVHAEIWLVVCR